MVALLNMLTLLVFRMFVSAYLIYWAVSFLFITDRPPLYLVRKHCEYEMVP